jgi:hypothetical protein
MGVQSVVRFFGELYAGVADAEAVVRLSVELFDIAQARLRDRSW